MVAALEASLDDQARRQLVHWLNLDLHRAFGLWLWVALFILAFTSISVNLNNEVVGPSSAWSPPLTPDAFDDRAPAPPNKPIEPKLTFPQAVDVASAEAGAAEVGTSRRGGAYDRSTGCTRWISFIRARSTARTA